MHRIALPKEAVNRKKRWLSILFEHAPIQDRNKMLRKEEARSKMDERGEGWTRISWKDSVIMGRCLEECGI